jgi:hypothetical protein
MNRIASLAASVIASALLSACIFAPPITHNVIDDAAFTKLSQQAAVTCGAGNVKEVNAKSFTCK